VRLGLEKDDARPAMIMQDVGKLELDGLKLPGAAAPVVFNGVADLEMKDISLEVATAHCVDLKVNATPFSVAASIVNQGRAGLAKVDVGIAEQHATQWVWLGANEKREIAFTNLKAPPAGEYEVRCGDLVKKWMAQ
jgi:hypothetical protein